MLNLSDKDLDRLSQEAAQQHEPGEIIGPKFWDKLEARLDRDLGKVNPNPARGIRRLPYYYAPAVLVILGMTYYLVRLNNRSQKNANSGSPPLTMVKPSPAEPLKSNSLSPNPVPSNSSNSTPTAPSNTVKYPGSAGATNAPAASASTHPNPNSPTSSPDATTASAHRNPNVPAASAHPNPDVPVRPASPSAPTNNSLTATNSQTSLSRHRQHNKPIGKPIGSNPDNNINLSSTTGAARTTGSRANSRVPSPISSPASSAASLPLGSPTSTDTQTASASPAPKSSLDLTYSTVRGPVRLTHTGAIDDSALRAFNVANIPQPIHKRALHINRSLDFGLVGAPDFASVNSVAANKAGSTFGITIDYQFANHWYIGSGLLYSRKIYAAAPQDYHVPPTYYRDNGMSMGGAPTVEFIKGRFNMLEIPLNLRYDFNTGGNTLFFVSAGASSYLFTNENCNYYYEFYNRPVTKGFTYTSDPNNLFSTLNLSMGVETGISNSFSVLIAPYFKIPTRNIGFGQVQLNSFGIDFALRFAPVLSRKRQ